MSNKNAIRSMFETDTVVERDGIWNVYAPGVEIRLARAGGSNQLFAKTLTRLCKPHRRAIQAESCDETILKDILIKVYALSVVTDWKGFTKDLITHDDADADTVLDFNTENVEAVLRAQPNLFIDIQKSADTLALYRIEIMEADSGN